MEYSIIITTCENKKQGEKIARLLLEEGLAACIQLDEISSYYIWKSEIQADNEVRLMIKTKKDLYAKIEEKIRENHSYEVPEIIMLPIQNGFNKYLKWIDEAVIS